MRRPTGYFQEKQKTRPRFAPGKYGSNPHGTRPKKAKYRIIAAAEEGRIHDLTTEDRAALPGRDFALPGARSYPIPDEAHARDALARVSANGTPREKRLVRAAVRRKFPEIMQTKGILARPRDSLPRRLDVTGPAGVTHPKKHLLKRERELAIRAAELTPEGKAAQKAAEYNKAVLFYKHGKTKKKEVDVVRSRLFGPY